MSMTFSHLLLWHAREMYESFFSLETQTYLSRVYCANFTTRSSWDHPVGINGDDCSWEIDNFELPCLMALLRPSLAWKGLKNEHVHEQYGVCNVPETGSCFLYYLYLVKRKNTCSDLDIPVVCIFFSSDTNWGGRRGRCAVKGFGWSRLHCLYVG